MKVHDVLDLPEAVRKGDFVQSLNESISEVERTVRNYAVTHSILACFRRALSIIDSSRRDGRSNAVYLHGSFGSGKSHFMAMLDLMLADNELVWKREELHPLRAENPWIEKTKVLQLPMNMYGATKMEDRIFSAYLGWLKENHPDATLPLLFKDAGLFDDARRMLDNIGEDAFFKALNGDTAKVEGWGTRAEAGGGWSRASFEEACESTDKAVRERLFDALVRSLFGSYGKDKDRYIEFDEGLGVISRHAAGLGYDVIVLYLDELILWLAGLATDTAFIEREAQKLVKLREANDESRAIPFVSFVARQRDISELVGDYVAGANRKVIEETLDHNEGRFEPIKLKDSNLPEIVAHRVVRPKDEAARSTLNDAFAKVWRSARTAVPTLIGESGDEDAFRKVYPFSPVLIEVLVALGDCLQRERTAIRILMELLVEHLPDQELGPIVPVGDAFDCIAEGEDAFDGIMGEQFERARHLYREDFLPMIREANATNTEDECQRLRPEHAATGLGCSGCPKTACRNDNRLVKTLLLAALVPRAKPFQDLTVSRLVHLNHGAISVPIPGTEINIAVGKVQKWAAEIPSMRVGDQKDPEVTLNLSSVDVRSIIRKAETFDTLGRRKLLLRRLLFRALGLPEDQSVVEAKIEWRGIKRLGQVRYGNVREMSDEALFCPDKYEWSVVIDYPFDEEGFSPQDDLKTLHAFRERHAGRDNATVVWLPTFFASELERELGELVVLENILESGGRSYVAHLRPDDQMTALSDLRSLREQKSNRIEAVLKKAYGMARADNEPLLDTTREVEEHTVSLVPGHSMRPFLAGNLRQGLETLVHELLQKRFPKHPRFPVTVTTARIKKVCELVSALIEEPEQKRYVDRGEKKDLERLADPLGLVDLSETTAHLGRHVLTDFETQRARASLESPTVAQCRGLLDPEGHKGLTRELTDLLTILAAHFHGRSVEDETGRAVALTPGKLPEGARLVKPELPAPTVWNKALDRAGRLFGITGPRRHLNARNLATLCEALDKALAKTDQVRERRIELERRLKGRGLEGGDRLTTANSASALIETLKAARGKAQVEALANAKLETSEEAVATSLARAATNHAKLSDGGAWTAFLAVDGLAADERVRNRVEGLRSELVTALSRDELLVSLSDTIDSLTRQAADLLREARPEPGPGPTPPGTGPVEKRARASSRHWSASTVEELETIFEELKQTASKAFEKGHSVTLELGESATESSS